MAWTGPIRDQQFNSATSGTTWTWSPTVTIPVGTLVVVTACGNSATTPPGIPSDNSTQPGAANTYTSVATRAGSAINSRVSFCVTTRSILTTDTITCSVGSAMTRRSGKLLTFTGELLAGPLDVSASVGPSGTPLVMGPTAALATTGELSLACSFWRGGAVLSGVSTATAGYTMSTVSAGSGGATPRVEANVAFKTTAGTAAESNTQSFTSVTETLGIIVTFKPSAGTVFSQSVSGSASFAGIRPKLAVQRKTLGSLTYSGAVVLHPTARRVTAGFAPSGSVTSLATLARTLTGALSFSGSRTAATSYARSLAAASLSFVGTRTSIKAVTKAISGALSFVGSSTRFPAKVLTAAFAPVGVLSRTLSLFRTLSAAFAPSAAAVKRLTSRKLLASLTPPAFFFTSTGANHFFAVFRPTGTTPTHSLPARTLFAGLQLTGSVVRFTSRQLVSSLIASGVMTSQYLPPVPVPEPGGGGFGAVMDSAFFVRYQVDGKWRGVKRVRA